MNQCCVICSQTEQFTVLWILFASIVLGNTAVLVALLLNKSRKSRMNFFIMHLALAGKDTLQRRVILFSKGRSDRGVEKTKQLGA